MLERIDQIVSLIKKRLRDELTPEEAVLLEEWASEHEENRKLLTMLTTDDSDALDEELILFANKRKRRSSLRIIYMTTISVAVALVLYFSIPHLASDKPPEKAEDKPTIAVTKPTPINEFPGQPASKAELVLANGDTIQLHEKADGLIVSQGAYNIYKYKNELRYETNSSAEIKEDLYSTIITPRGGQFKIKLPDTSNIILNVDSYVKFKINPRGLKDTITLKGEVAFEITKKNKPVIVSVQNENDNKKICRIEVVGTRFNVNAYDNASIRKITLLEGMLKVSAPDKPRIVGLGERQQALMDNDGNIKIDSNVDADDAISWKSGLVKFKETPAQEVLSTLQKWFDVKLGEETKKIKGCAFTGEITPTTNINAVIFAMNYTCSDLNLSYDTAQKKLVRIKKP